VPLGDESTTAPSLPAPFISRAHRCYHNRPEPGKAMPVTAIQAQEQGHPLPPLPRTSHAERHQKEAHQPPRKSRPCFSLSKHFHSNGNSPKPYVTFKCCVHDLLTTKAKGVQLY